MTTAFMQQNEATTLAKDDLLYVERAEINFRNVARDRVLVSVWVRNSDGAASAPTFLTLQAAPLGAFVRWRDMARIAVPSIKPFSAVEVSAVFTVPETKPIGDFSDIPPRRLLTALADDDEPSRSAATTGDAMVDFLRQARRWGETTDLPDDPFHLLTRPGAHWAGNINVLIGNHSVERHMAQALRIYPGRLNLAMFIVGERRDEYKFDLAGSRAMWDAALYDATMAPNLSAPFQQVSVLPPSQWIKVDGTVLVVLAVCPPEFCDKGEVEVHVCQRSTGREAVVEFSLDPHAAGAGCYAVS